MRGFWNPLAGIEHRAQAPGGDESGGRLSWSQLNAIWNCSLCHQGPPLGVLSRLSNVRTTAANAGANKVATSPRASLSDRVEQAKCSNEDMSHLQSLPPIPGNCEVTSGSCVWDCCTAGGDSGMGRATRSIDASCLSATSVKVGTNNAIGTERLPLGGGLGRLRDGLSLPRASDS